MSEILLPQAAISISQVLMSGIEAPSHSAAEFALNTDFFKDCLSEIPGIGCRANRLGHGLRSLMLIKGRSVAVAK
jgi:hypothetical protein